MLSLIRIIVLFLWLVAAGRASAQDYNFGGPMTRPQLASYLERGAVTEFDSLHRGVKAYNDVIEFSATQNIRIMYSVVGVGYASELPLAHGFWDSLTNLVSDIRLAYRRHDNVVPIVNAAIWESVSRNIDSIWMDSTVYAAYNVPIRRFCFDSIKYAGDTSSVHCFPDITRPETQMYFYYVATHLIDCGIEDIHFGQVQLENHNDAGNVYTWDLYTRIRRYGALKNRGLVLINGDTYGLFLKNTDSLVYDYHTAPSRVSGYYTGSDSTWSSMWNFSESAYGGPGRLGYTECSPYGKMLGGMTPMGWYADTIPYQVALDNTLTNLCNCVAAAGCWSAYGFDEISWFVLQSASYRNKWLCYARNEVKVLDRNCNFVMPIRTLFTRHWWYYIALNGYGFNQENTITDILNGNATDCDPNDVLDLHALYFNGQKDPTAVIAYPNPSSGNVNIVFHGGNKQKVSIRIADMTGREIVSWYSNVSQGVMNWDPGGIEPGVYTCTVSAPDCPSATTKITLVR